MSESEVRIVSDGTAFGTCVYANDKLLDTVCAVSWSVKVDEFAEATITFENVAVEVVGRQREKQRRLVERVRELLRPRPRRERKPPPPPPPGPTMPPNPPTHRPVS